jgi:hypothetical protein
MYMVTKYKNKDHLFSSTTFIIALQTIFTTNSPSFIHFGSFRWPVDLRTLTDLFVVFWFWIWAPLRLDTITVMLFLWLSAYLHINFVLAEIITRNISVTF